MWNFGVLERTADQPFVVGAVAEAFDAVPDCSSYCLFSPLRLVSHPDTYDLLCDGSSTYPHAKRAAEV